MKTPKEKATKLVDKIHSANKLLNYSRAKTIALICVDEKIQMILDFENNDEIGNYWFFDDTLEELYEVKQEIEKL